MQENKTITPLVDNYDPRRQWIPEYCCVGKMSDEMARKTYPKYRGKTIYRTCFNLDKDGQTVFFDAKEFPEAELIDLKCMYRTTTKYDMVYANATNEEIEEYGMFGGKYTFPSKLVSLTTTSLNVLYRFAQIFDEKGLLV